MPLTASLSQLNRAPKILVLGSGGLSIGQAGEFDYSGTQAIKALREESCDVVVVNPNIATVQTNPENGVLVYLYPVTVPWVTRVIEKERPDAIVAGFGGQTALNCLIGLDEGGILEKYNIQNLGTPAAVLRMTEDRDAFAAKMREIGKPIPESFACSTLVAATEAAEKVGYPVIIRAAYALGGLGSGFADNQKELEPLVSAALASSPQVLVEKSLRGWKEVEYEVMRDSADNTITICNMENFDPLGIHTGDSIVVAPSQTLSDDEFQILRNAAIDIVDALGVIGECNVQYALSPDSNEYFVIEVNARLSRSSALASKATGYPIAYIAGKVVLGYDLLELKNPVTGVTFAFFEPAMDYLAIKVPRWDLQKFSGVSRKLGSTMKSVGEVMSIGRNFPEAIQKAVRMVTEQAEGLSAIKPQLSQKEIENELAYPTDGRLYYVLDALRQGMDIEQIHAISKINQWFIHQIKLICDVEKAINRIIPKKDGLPTELIKKAISGIDKQTMTFWKTMGFGDEQIAYLILGDEQDKTAHSESTLQESSLLIRKKRVDLGVVPVVKKIDTTAAEYPSPSNYLYMTYSGQYHDDLPDDEKVFSAIVLGGGAYRIGTSVEFDWCAVSCSRRLQSANWRSVIINCNPETVSTDYNASDRLYFEELTLERIMDISDFENPIGVIACMGGQQPNRLALPLAKAGLKLLGHKPSTVDNAEDRSQFSALLDRLNIKQPKWVSAKSKDDVLSFVDKVGFPVLIRPSYVLSGAAMNVAYNHETLDRCLSLAAEVSPDHPTVISEFVNGAREIELDGVARNGEIITSVVSEHVENAGVHSGDATTVVPAQRIYVETARRIRRAGQAIAAGLSLNGPFNIQFLAKDGEIKVIECNARAARSFPFVSKTVGINLADVATDIIIGIEPKLNRLNEDNLPYVGVKAAMFSFTRLAGADPILGVEMAATGEVGCIAHTFSEALLLSLEAAGMNKPTKGVLVSSGAEKDKLRFLKAAQALLKMGLPLYATEGTGKYLKEHNLDCKILKWPDEGRGEKDVIDAIKNGLVDLVINLPKNTHRKELTRGSMIRQAATRFGCSLLTNMEKTIAYVQALEKCEDFEKSHELLRLGSYR